MKRLYFFLLMIITLAACNPYHTYITTTKNYPAVNEYEPFFVYYNEQKMPDSAEYIGDISAYFVPSGGYGSSASLARMVEDNVKDKGGNAMQFNKQSDDDKKNNVIFRGKIYRLKPFEKVKLNFDSLKAAWKKDKPDKYEGFYEDDWNSDEDNQSDEKKVFYACLKKDSGNYVMFYLNGFEDFKEHFGEFVKPHRLWKKGDVFANLNKTVNSNIFKSTIYTYNKALIDDIMMKFDNGNIRCYFSGSINILRKVFPDSAAREKLSGSLTGFSINNNRIVTCYHGVSEKDTKIFVKGINKDFDKKYEAVVDKFDKVNDIAVIKLIDSTINLGDNPFTLNEEEKGVAEEVFVLGYPMSLMMGEEIKLTNGIISSKSGFAGDISAYQISAPVQPGNSGAPLFDKKGCLIGMINSKLMKADNVAYSIKSKHLKTFFSNSGYATSFRTQNDLSSMSLADQVKSVQNSIYIIEIIDTKDTKDTKSKPTTKKKKKKSDEDAFSGE